MNFQLFFTDKSAEQFNKLKESKALEKRFKAVRKTLALMETNIKHPSLNTHKYNSIKAPGNEDVFEYYTENKSLKGNPVSFNSEVELRQQGNLVGNSEAELRGILKTNKTPGAYRVFWYYGPDKKQITILSITPHP